MEWEPPATIRVPQPPRESARLVIDRPHAGLLLIVLAVLISPWLYALQDVRLRPTTTAAVAPRANGALNKTESRGPWGQLVVQEIEIAPPLEYVDLRADLSQQPRWCFPDFDAAKLAESLDRLSLSHSTSTQILDLARLDPALGGLVVEPPAELVWNLTPDERGALYHELALHPANSLQEDAFRYDGPLEEWLGGSDLSKETVNLVNRLAYYHGRFTFLADANLVLSKIDKSEQARLIKSLSAARTQSIRLRVSDQDDIKKLAAYWGRGKRAKDVTPILESLARRPGGGEIDLIHLLPGFARMRLYTYPVPQHAEKHNAALDCQWSAFNFFSLVPDDRFCDVDYPLRDLKANYHLVERNFRLGDLVVYVDANQNWFHSAIYIADDILFTKNGSSHSSPWMFMRMDRMKEFYPRSGQVDVNYFRRNAS